MEFQSTFCDYSFSKPNPMLILHQKLNTINHILMKWIPLKRGTDRTTSRRTLSLISYSLGFYGLIQKVISHNCQSKPLLLVHKALALMNDFMTVIFLRGLGILILTFMTQNTLTMIAFWNPMASPGFHTAIGTHLHDNRQHSPVGCVHCNACTPIIVEALSRLAALKQAERVSWSNLWIRLDALNIINFVKSTAEITWHLLAIYLILDFC